MLPASAGSYGTRDLYADANGDLYLWLPDGDYRFEANGRGYTATVDGADAERVRGIYEKMVDVFYAVDLGGLV